MSKDKIDKITKLKNIESFLQINFIKGHKYVDKAGEFVNALYNNDSVPFHTMRPDGMEMKLGDNKELRVSSYNLWIHFLNPDSFEMQKQELLKSFELVNSIFKPGKYTRVGWRNYFIYEYSGECPQIIDNDNLYGGEFNEIILNKKIENLDSRISISKVAKKDKEQDAILFDIDMYKRLEVNAVNVDEINRTIMQIANTINSKELLELVNKILS